MLKPVLTLISQSFPVSDLVAGDLVKFTNMYYLIIWNDDHKKQLHYQMHGGDQQFCLSYSGLENVSLFGFVEKDVSHV